MKTQRFLFLVLAMVLASVPATVCAASYAVAAADASLKSAFANPVDDPHLPRVLIIGDSISIGYTIPVRKELKGVANVHRPAENCQHTGHGLAKIDRWLGTNHWDAIHFNWGIWDTHYLYKTNNGLVMNDRNVKPDDVRIRYTVEQYRENLRELVETLKKTGAKLVWATSTPILSRSGDRFKDIARYNEVAAAVMNEAGVATDDLYTPALEHAAQWQRPDKVHYGELGCQELGKLVSGSIREALKP